MFGKYTYFYNFIMEYFSCTQKLNKKMFFFLEHRNRRDTKLAIPHPHNFQPFNLLITRLISFEYLIQFS